MLNLRTVIDNFKTYLVHQDLSDNTIRNYIADINNFIDWYYEQHAEEAKVKDITSYHLSFFRDYIINAKRLKVATVNRKIQTLKRFFNFLANKKIIKTNTAKPLKFIRRAKPIKPMSLNKSEIHSLLSVAARSPHGLSSRNYAIIQLLLQTGLRVSELINLQWRDITIYERSGHIRGSVEEPP